MEKKKTWKRFLPEIVLVAAVALAAGVFLLVRSSGTKTENLIATVSRGKTVLATYDLSKEGEERTVAIEGSKTAMTLAVKKGAIKVAESGCPTQYCVHQGYASDSSHPIVCAYNEVTIVLSGGEESGSIIL